MYYSQQRAAEIRSELAMRAIPDQPTARVIVRASDGRRLRPRIAHGGGRRHPRIADSEVPYQEAPPTREEQAQAMHGDAVIEPGGLAVDLLNASYMASEVAIQELRDQVNVDVSEVASQNCAVCLDPLGGEAVVRWSGSHGGPEDGPCGHQLHRACALQAATNSNRCPQCRAPVEGVEVRAERRVQVAAQTTTWPPMPPAELATQTDRHANRLADWLRTRPNIYDPSSRGGASYLFVPVLHHALRRAGIPLPFFIIPDRQRDQYAWNRVAQVTLNSQWGGRVVEAAWERLCTAAGRLDEWRTVLRKAEESVRHYIRESTVPTLEDRLNGREEWPPVPDSSNSAIASTSVAVLAVDGGYLGQRIQEALLAGNPCEPDADARQHAIYLAAQMVTHVCGPVEVERAPPLTPSQVAARDLVDRQDREYEEARMQDLQRSPPEEEATPASVSDPVGDEPSAGEMRRARLRRFGLPSH